MMDVAEKEGLHLDIKALEKTLQIPVVPMVAAKSKGLEALTEAILKKNPPSPPRRWSLMPIIAARMPGLEQALQHDVPDMPAAQHFMEVLRSLADDTLLATWETRAPTFVRAIQTVQKELEKKKIPYRQAEIMGRYNWLASIVADVVTQHKDPARRSLTDRLDAVLTHRLGGPFLFLLLLTLIFQAVFSWAVPAMDLVETSISGLGNLTRSSLPDHMVTDLLVDGVITGVGNVVVFLPQILLLFFFLGLMEDTGYMARTAFIMDRIMKKVGLSGASVVPLLSSFACAIPGIMAARTLDNERDRLITIMVAPLMSCSARLPVYTLFIAAFIPAGTLFGFIGYQGLAMFSMYLMGTVMAFVAAWILKRLVFKGTSSYFVMELPPYRRPRLQQVFWRMVQRSKVFVVRAGKIIFSLSVVLWFLANYPRSVPPQDLRPQVEEERQAGYVSIAERYQIAPQALQPLHYADTDTLSAAHIAAREALQVVEETYERRMLLITSEEKSYQVRQSFIGILGRTLEPVMQPLGFDWKMSAGIVAAFAAREVIISTLGILYSVGGDADETSLVLQAQLEADRYPDGQPVYTPLVAISLLIFFVFALQCMSTLAIARRETNSWLWPAVMWLYMTGIAYIGSLIVYQGGRALGFT